VVLFMRHQPQLQLPVTTAHPSSAQLSVGVCWQALHMPHILRSWKSSPQGHFQDAATGLVKSKLKLHKICLQWSAYWQHSRVHRQIITQPKVVIYFDMPSSVCALWLSPSSLSSSTFLQSVAKQICTQCIPNICTHSA